VTRRDVTKRVTEAQEGTPWSPGRSRQRRGWCPVAGGRPEPAGAGRWGGGIQSLWGDSDTL